MQEQAEGQLQFDIECRECGGVDARTRIGGLLCLDCIEAGKAVEGHVFETVWRP